MTIILQVHVDAAFVDPGIGSPNACDVVPSSIIRVITPVIVAIWPELATGLAEVVYN